MLGAQWNRSPMPWPQYDLTTWKPALATCALMMSPTSR